MSLLFSDMIIKNLKAREILDSRGWPTVEAEIETENGFFCASVPSGTSRGKYEAVELRDGDSRFFGQGVQKTVKNIEEVIGPRLKRRVLKDQKEIDQILLELDGRENKSRLGANAILAVSMACCRAGAASRDLPLYEYINKIFNFQFSIFKLPRLCFLLIEGGKHAGNDLEIQEFMVVPQLESFKENLRAGVEVYHRLEELIEKEYGKQASNVGYEGGFAPALKKTREVLDLIMEAIKKAGYKDKMKIGIDAAASEFVFVSPESAVKEEYYQLGGQKLTSQKLLEFYEKIIKKYPILFLEDPFREDDWLSWQRILNLKSEMLNLLIVGDDLTVTNPKRINEARQKNACNCVIIKPNQIGTLTETLAAAKLAREFGWKLIVSHRSGETNDDFIADLAVGLGADFVKFGAPARGERVAKYNRLLNIEEEICPK